MTLNFTGNLNDQLHDQRAQPVAARGWWAAGAFSMGMGIWPMHFVGNTLYAIYRMYAVALRHARPILPIALRQNDSQSSNACITPILDANRYLIEIRKEMILDKPLYAGRTVDLPDMVVYGTSEEAVRDDVHYELGRLSIMTGQHRRHCRAPGNLLAPGECSNLHASKSVARSLRLVGMSGSSAMESGVHAGLIVHPVLKTDDSVAAHRVAPVQPAEPRERKRDEQRR